MTNAEINQKFAEKVAKGIFRPVIRYITGSDPEERLAEAVALTFELSTRRRPAPASSSTTRSSSTTPACARWTWAVSS